MGNIDWVPPPAGVRKAGTRRSLAEVVDARISRRGFLLGVSALAVGAGIGGLAPAAEPSRAFGFKELAAGSDATHHVAEGYDAEVLLRWGDPIFPDSPPFDPEGQTAERQKRQFGYNNDFLGFFPIAGSARHGLLVANHEYTNEELMFLGVGVQSAAGTRFAGMTRELVDVEMAAHGGTVVEVKEEGGRWAVVRDSRFNRRITAETPMRLAGPAAGGPRMRTAADPDGRTVAGMVANCSGGVTPWGTWLSGEENFNGFFLNQLPAGHPEAEAQERYGMPRASYGWGRHHDRFDLAKEPNEPNRFGWIVEIDPFDPQSTPVKRTALGRFKHEGAAGTLTGDGRYVVYMGDDEEFEYVYKFVTSKPFRPGDKAWNAALLDEGTLYAARFDDDGTGEWLPLVQGLWPLIAANGFASQADVLIEARRAADFLGATEMDRPEDFEVSPKSGRAYVMLTNNSRRKADETDAANPRAANAFGHVIELAPRDGDHAATAFRWEILVRCGDPSKPEVGATFSPATSGDGWFGMPDNCAFDGEGRLWVATDGNSGRTTGRSDGLWAVETEGERRGTSRHFFQVPVGAELCGPCFTPDDAALFLAVQHPAEGGRASLYENPSTRWPDFDPKMPPRPSVVVVTRKGGGRIG